ncbi:thiopurine S-methyltransferase [Pseudoteredinibacter isoporae]|uniref:Thiopurine S-methyltransferase n=1 Tax=Pseudoteredinibacter isoporae TaxID=570281 RepID=A0A7X0JW65_9GAMM|nr:thiopurine S-methyltransferase [Pseudoteredinibacter isoporae]MBB6522833.1 thiopurine S-methyltransferase [Pseudoteredinibacter isoporae]NHO88360.1 thiopurine S-methyltransferase [Pseudoteredinibacter isoporae]NIB23309.1 thiopurine S-methyltransferase [Pseudoteredinibacter isoporae]
MEKEFWLQRWQEQQIGFHEGRFNNSLVQYWPQLKTPKAACVFVPLCGKSQDMVFFAEQGMHVIGIELSALAVEAFFQEQDLTPDISQEDELQCYRAGPYTLYCGDVFALHHEHLKDCHWVYDRAALIALPESMRSHYCRQLANILPRPCRSLVITLEYDQGLKAGPPFSISPDSLSELYCEIAEIETLGNCTEEVKGISAIEHSFALTYR